MDNDPVPDCSNSDKVAPEICTAPLCESCRTLRWSAWIERALDHELNGGDDRQDAESHSVDHGGDRTPASASSAHGAKAEAAECFDYRRLHPSPQDSPSPQDEKNSATAAIAVRAWIATGRIDRASVLAAIIGVAAYLALACISLLLSRTGETVSPIWLPNACAVAFLLRTRIGNELPFLAAAFAGSVGANAVGQLPMHVALVFSLGNMVEIIAVLALARKAVHAQPDMIRLADLARFVWAGGLVGPLLSAAVTAPLMGASLPDVRLGAITWFLTNSMAMVLIVPTVLLLFDRLTGRQHAAQSHPAESLALHIGGMVCAFLVFNQTHYPLVFLIQPITLLHAFRLGSLGSALHVGGVALVAAVMTWSGLGPIAAASGGGMTQLHLLQAFIAANFLTGLPVAAILAGRDRMMAELEAGKQQVDLLADNITDAVLRYDLDGVCTYASPSVREVMGLPPEAPVGLHAGLRLHPVMRAKGRWRRLAGCLTVQATRSALPIGVRSTPPMERQCFWKPMARWCAIPSPARAKAWWWLRAM